MADARKDKSVHGEEAQALLGVMRSLARSSPEVRDVVEASGGRPWLDLAWVRCTTTGAPSCRVLVDPTRHAELWGHILTLEDDAAAMVVALLADRHQRGRGRFVVPGGIRAGPAICAVEEAVGPVCTLWQP